MFKELVPILRNRAVLMTATALDDDQIRVNVVPKKMKDGDHDALTTPLSVTGTAEELDTQLAATLVGFVASHLQMKNALEKAKADMDAATKLRRPRRAPNRRRRQGQYRRRRKSYRMLHRQACRASEARTAEVGKPLRYAAGTRYHSTAAPAEPEDDPGFAEIDDDEPIEEVEELDDAA